MQLARSLDQYWTDRTVMPTTSGQGSMAALHHVVAYRTSACFAARLDIRRSKVALSSLHVVARRTASFKPPASCLVLPSTCFSPVVVPSSNNFACKQ